MATLVYKISRHIFEITPARVLCVAGLLYLTFDPYARVRPAARALGGAGAWAALASDITSAKCVLRSYNQ
jgi:hypothetical protein